MPDVAGPDEHPHCRVEHQRLRLERVHRQKRFAVAGGQSAAVISEQRSDDRGYRCADGVLADKPGTRRKIGQMESSAQFGGVDVLLPVRHALQALGRRMQRMAASQTSDECEVPELFMRLIPPVAGLHHHALRISSSGRVEAAGAIRGATPLRGTLPAGFG